MSAAHYLAGAAAERHISATEHANEMAQLRAMAEERIRQLNDHIARLQHRLEVSNHRLEESNKMFFAYEERIEKLDNEKDLALRGRYTKKVIAEKAEASGRGLADAIKDEGEGAVEFIKDWIRKNVRESSDELIEQIEIALRGRMQLTFERELRKKYVERVESLVGEFIHANPDKLVTEDVVERIQLSVLRDIYQASEAESRP